MDVGRCRRSCERRLQGAAALGEVGVRRRFTRGRYATDASHYQIMPLGVVTPRTMEEAERAIAICRAEGVPRDCRAAAARRRPARPSTHSLIIDCSKHLNRILDLDVAGRRCRGRARHRARRPQPRAQAARPVVSGRRLDRLARHHRRHDRQQLLRRRARCATATRARTCSRSTRCWPTARRRISGRSRADLSDLPANSPLRPLARDLFALGAREADEIAARFPEGAAPGRRLQSRRAGAGAKRRQPRAHPGRLGRHARLLHRDRAEAVAAARPARGRRLPFRQLPRGDGGGAAHRQARRRSRSSWSIAP